MVDPRLSTMLWTNWVSIRSMVVYLSVNSLMQDSSEMQRLWLQAIAKTKSRSPVTFEQWFSGVQFDGLNDNMLHLSARNEFVRDWVHDHFVPDLVDQLAAALGVQRVTVKWQVQRELECPVVEPQHQTIRGPAIDAECRQCDERSRMSSQPPADKSTEAINVAYRGSERLLNMSCGKR